MINEKNRLKGLVTVTVKDKDGNVKRIPNNWFRKLLKLPEKKMQFKHHNTITTQGDGLIADLMSGTPSQVKVDGTNGYMAVGDDWTGVNPKNNTFVNYQVGPYKKLDEGFPKLSGDYGSEGQNVVLYRASFNAGELEANGINEVCLLNGNTKEAKCLAYAEITPSVNLTISDSLQIDWQITVMGS